MHLQNGDCATFRELADHVSRISFSSNVAGFDDIAETAQIPGPRRAAPFASINAGDEFVELGALFAKLGRRYAGRCVHVALGERSLTLSVV